VNVIRGVRQVAGANIGMALLAANEFDLDVRSIGRPRHEVTVANVFSDGPRRSANFAIVQRQFLQLEDTTGRHV